MALNRTISAALLAAAGLMGTAPAAQASTVSTGWVSNPIVTKALCLALGREIGEEAGYEVTTDEVSARLKNDEGDMVIIICDAEPYLFFLAVHDTKQQSEVRAIADDIERRLVARVDALAAR